MMKIHSLIQTVTMTSMVISIACTSGGLSGPNPAGTVVKSGGTVGSGGTVIIGGNIATGGYRYTGGTDVTGGLQAEITDKS